MPIFGNNQSNGQLKQMSQQPSRVASGTQQNRPMQQTRPIGVQNVANKRPLGVAQKPAKLGLDQQKTQKESSFDEKINSGAGISREDIEGMIQIQPEHFGPLRQFVEDEKITDVDYNGTDLWVRDYTGMRRKVTDPNVTQYLDTGFVNRFAQRVANSVSKEFNPQNPLLEAETKVLRISIVHDSVANGRKSICIRKTPATVKISTKHSIETNYAAPETLAFLRNAILAHFNITVCGEPGTGKTEFTKYLSLNIPPQERVITIEDNLEWHYHEIKPEADCVEMQVSKRFPYELAIKACLRQNPNWIMIAEVRSVEVVYYMQQLTTGVNGMTSLHTDDVKRVPERLCNMAAGEVSRERMEADIYGFLDLAVLIDIRKDETGQTHRRIAQIGMFYTDEEGNYHKDYVLENGKLTKFAQHLPQRMIDRFKHAHIDDPFFSEKVWADAGLDPSTYTPIFDINNNEESSLDKRLR